MNRHRSVRQGAVPQQAETVRPDWLLFSMRRCSAEKPRRDALGAIRRGFLFRCGLWRRRPLACSTVFVNTCRNCGCFAMGGFAAKGAALFRGRVLCAAAFSAVAVFGFLRTAGFNGGMAVTAACVAIVRAGIGASFSVLREAPTKQASLAGSALSPRSRLVSTKTPIAAGAGSCGASLLNGDAGSNLLVAATSAIFATVRSTADGDGIPRPARARPARRVPVAERAKPMFRAGLCALSLRCRRLRCCRIASS